MTSEAHGNAFCVTSKDPCTGYHAIFEDDGRTGYLYIRNREAVLSHVWVYNLVAAPLAIELDPNGNDAPLNSSVYAPREPFGSPPKSCDVTFVWHHGKMITDVSLYLKIRGCVMAKLVPGVDPGWALLPLRSGPLAKILRPSDLIDYSESYILESSDRESGLLGRFEDNGRVAYLYLLEEERIIGEVWVYNRAPAHSGPNCDDLVKGLPVNPDGYASTEPFPPIESLNDLQFWWSGDAEHEAKLTLALRGEVLAVLVPGARPGWSRQAIRDGPLARVLRPENR